MFDVDISDEIEDNTFVSIGFYPIIPLSFIGSDVLTNCSYFDFYDFLVLDSD